MTTAPAPASLAAIAASRAALPPPITMMSQLVLGGMGVDQVTRRIEIAAQAFARR
jgi:hypothetical protein